MEYSKRPTLMSYLASEPAEYFLGKGLFGKRRISGYDCLRVNWYMYETGAILGRARRNKLTTLIKILPVVAGEEDSFITSLKEDARKRLNQFKREREKEPDSFKELLFDTELTRMMRSSPKMLKDKASEEDVYAFFERWGAAGIGFGSFFPELTERMYRSYYESTVGEETWAWWGASKRAGGWGLKLPKEPTPSAGLDSDLKKLFKVMKLEERERQILRTVAAYTSEYYSELLDPLDLRGYLEV